ncbi:hypothetical protein WA026_001454 [Henosepilachna vigintioctopunctata]|uniref:Uncharacterized protein n=1 Tax=Henosepilachna vigintioctopunctata TaxID=420089 RepID=A0AAW1UI58_9CUCU
MYPKKIMKQELIDEASTGSLGIAQESGWMTTAVFYKWLVNFQAHVKASLDDIVLLVVISYSIISVIKVQYSTKLMAKQQRSKLHVNGIQKTGLWPVDPNVFPDYLFEPAETTNIPMQQDRIEHKEDSTAAKNLAGPSQVAESISTSLIIANTSAADNPRPLSAAQSRDRVTAIPMTPTSYKMILQDMNSNVPIIMPSPVPKGIYVAGQGKRKPRKKLTVLLSTSTPNIEEAKAKSAPPPVPKKNTRKVTKALDFNSDSENDLSFLLETEDDDKDCPFIYCNDVYSRFKPKEV